MKRLLVTILTFIVLTFMISITAFASISSRCTGIGSAPVIPLEEPYTVSYYTHVLVQPEDYTACKITSPEELANKFSSEELKTKYDEAFFENKFLYTIGYEAADSSYSISVANVDITEDSINIKSEVEIDTEGGAFLDMIFPWSIILEFDNAYLDTTITSEITRKQDKYITLKSKFPWPTAYDPAIIKPLERSFRPGYAEDGVGDALYLFSGDEANQTATQYVYIPDTFNLTGVDVIRLRYKSTAPIDTYFSQNYDLPVGYVLSATMAQDVKGILGDSYSNYFDENGKCIYRFSSIKNSDRVTLPSTDDKWTTLDIPITAFGDKEFLNIMHSVAEFYNLDLYDYHLMYSWKFTGATFDKESGKSITIDSFTGMWEKAGVTKADLSNDGRINITDFAQLKNFIELEATPNYYPAADVNQDGNINVTDIAILKNYIELDNPID